MYKLKHTKKNILNKKQNNKKQSNKKQNNKKQNNKKQNNKTQNNKKQSNKKQSNKNKLLNGGVFLGEGSFGCVITPAIPCTNNILNIRKQNFSKSVSKILIDPSEDDKDEIIISNKLKSIDPQQYHFITFESSCYLKKLPNERSNTASVEYDNDTLSSYDILDNKKYDKKYCPIDLRLKPINLIMPYGGYDLLHISKNKCSKKNLIHFTLTKTMLSKNFKSCLQNIITGLFKMHNNRIVNRDIKSENMMVNYDETTKRLDLRFIDFGLSTMIPSYYKRKENINYRGTEGCISPELIITYYILNGETYEKTMENINKYIKNVLSSFKKYELIEEFKLLEKFNSDMKELYLKIEREISNNTVYDKYFGIDTMQNLGKFNGYLQKGDVYALGITICDFLKTYNNNNKPVIKYDKSLHELLINMIQPNPEKRFNIIQCLKHPYFTK